MKRLILVSCDISNPKTRERELPALFAAGAKLNCTDLLLITDHENGEEKRGDLTVRIGEPQFAQLAAIEFVCEQAVPPRPIFGIISRMKKSSVMLAAGLALAAVTATAATNTVVATVETSLGSVELELDAAKAPVTVSNFVAYAKAGHYEGTIFHRVIDGFMIQGGGFTAEMVQKETKAPIRNEAANGLKNARGTIAMARTMVVDSATSQFFINLKDNAFLDFRAPNPQMYGYAVFGHVTKGMEVVDKIAQVKTGNRFPHQNVPLEPVVIKNVTVKE